MVTTIEEYNKQLEYVITDIKQRLLGGSEITPPHLQCYQLDKPIHVLTANVENYQKGLIDKGDYYEMMYPRFGELNKSYLNNFCWIIDEHTIFIIERPFKNRVIKLLKQLLPNCHIRSIKNDLMIDGYKIGPTCMAGYIDNWNGENNKECSSLIYCLRWDDLEGLNNIFKDDPHHQDRLQHKAPISCLSNFLKVTKQEFIDLIEKQM